MKKLAKFSTKWHRRLGWYGGFVVLVWALSGMTHPLMSWTGPKAKQFFPPRLNISQQNLPALASALSGPAITQALRNHTQILKVVPSADTPVIQATIQHQPERHYWSTINGQKLTDYDRQHAIWLANYYTGLTTKQLLGAELITEFSDEYPWVNRLLPVYRVAYQTDNKLVAFVHTETGALASLTDARKSAIRSVFQHLHTWQWLDATGFGRVLLIALLMLSLFFMSITGIALIFALKQRKIKDNKRHWHRLVGYVIWLPLMGWSASGFYHLLQSEYVDNISGMRLDQPLDLSSLTQLNLQALAPYTDKSFNAISLVRGDHTPLLFRLAIAQERGRNDVNRAKKYAGQAREKKSIYLNAQSGEEVNQGDRNRAIWLANQHSGLSQQHIESVNLITRFGPAYDFRNKRLPVWQVTYNDADGSHYFIDPATGILVERTRKIDRIERLSFSLLHKWNHLNAFMKRQSRDILIVITLIVALVFNLLGLLMMFNKKRERAQQNTAFSAKTEHASEMLN